MNHITSTQRRLIILGLTSLLGASSVGLAQPAAALPSNCNYAPTARTWSPTDGAYALCRSGTGSYQAWRQCRNRYGFYTMAYGPWVGVGATSYAFCPWTHDKGVSYGISYRR